MISIIICSRNNTINDALLKNIKSSIGCEYELIVIDNSENQYSIFEAYNEGIRKSKFEILCFMHDDILIHTNHWGDILLKIFLNDNEVGLIGVAGTKVKTKNPSGWWNCPDDFKQINIIQHLSDDKVEKWDYGFKNQNLTEVVAVDGVFMALKKVENIFFNTKLKGFHNYDLNISFEYKIKGYKIVTTKDILIEHFSNGIINQSWYKSTLRIHEIYKSHLPLLTNDNGNFDIQVLEFNNGIKFINGLLDHGFNHKIIKIWISLFFIKPFDKSHIKIMKRLLKILVNYSSK